MEVLGVLSGIGHLPVEVARSAKSLGYEVVAVGLVPGIDEELQPSVDHYYDINIGKVGKIISTLNKTSLVTLPIMVTLVTLCFFKVEIILPTLPILIS